ncbi:hypothetical protein Tco_1549485 [Tanacetum coccineum]
MGTRSRHPICFAEVGDKSKFSVSLAQRFIHEPTKRIFQIQAYPSQPVDRQKSNAELVTKTSGVSRRDKRSMLKSRKLKKCMADEPLAIPLDEIHVDDKLNFIEEPVEIMDCEVKRLKQSHIPIVKVRWNSKRGPEFTWEREDQMQKKYPHLFTNSAPAAEVAS